MKKLSLTTVFLAVFFSAFSQADSMYVVTGDSVIAAYATDKIDSVIFYRPSIVVTVKEKYIPANYMDTLTWTNTWLMPYSDTTIGFDFSANDYTDTNRDGYLNLPTLSFENAVVFGGENKVKNLGVMALNVEYKIPKVWDVSNNPLVIGNYYVVQCKDGYAIFRVKSYMTCCTEYEIDFVFVATANIEEK